MAEAIDIRELNERIERQSAFVTNLMAGMDQVIVGQKHLVESLLIGLLALSIRSPSQSNAPNSFCKLAISISETFPKIVFMIPILIFIFCFQILFSRKINRKKQTTNSFQLVLFVIASSVYHKRSWVG